MTHGIRPIVLRASAVALMFALSTTRPADAEPKSITVDELSKIVSGMGLEDAGDKKSVVRIENQGKSGVEISMSPWDDGHQVTFYAFLGDVPKEKLAALPAKKMLEYDDTAEYFFSLGGNENRSIFLQTRIDASLITPKLLRERIDGILDAVETKHDLWDSEKWPAASTTADASGKSYASLMAEANAAWDKAPLALKVLTFTKGEQEGAGHYVPTKDSTFHQGETAWVYMEPLYFLAKTNPDGAYTAGVSVDISLKNKAGDGFTDAKNLLDKPEVTYTLPHLYSLRLHFAFNGKEPLPVGDYRFDFTLHDLNSTKTATASLPFTIAK